jgi:hypothetical protein
MGNGGPNAIHRGGRPPNSPSPQWLDERVERCTESGCWLWIGAASKDGYGVAKIKNAQLRAHRLAWQIFNGAIPRGLLACHRCDVPLCCNPAHLFLGTVSDNVRDAVAKGRWRGRWSPRV